MNIIWETPDGIAVTTLTDEAQQHIQRAQALAHLDGNRESLSKEQLADLDYYDWVKNSIGLSSEEHAQILKSRGAVPDDYVFVGHDQDVPADRSFRDAWCWRGMVDHDMEKCREIHKERLRAVRAPLLLQKDAEFMIAIERGDQQAMAAIAAEKQALRDVTSFPEIEAASTPEELKGVWPEVLSERKK